MERRLDDGKAEDQIGAVQRRYRAISFRAQGIVRHYTVGRPALKGRKPTEEELLAQCLGHEIVYISDEVVTARCIQAWQQSGMKLLGCGRGTPVNVDWRAVCWG